MTRLQDALAELATMSLARLRAEWRRHHRGQIIPTGLGRDLASRAIAFRLQERVDGGLPPAQARALARLAKQLEEGGDMELSSQRSMKPGTKLVRQWHGQTYHVLVLEGGFEFRDRYYRSLTPIARQITGAAWSGPRFFGLKVGVNGGE